MIANLRYWLLFLLTRIVLILLCVGYLNITMRYGNHILVATGIQKPDGINQIFHSKFISRAYLESQGLRCEFELFDPKEQILSGNAPRYKAVPSMFVFYDLFGRDLSQDDAGYFSKLTYAVISHCDREALLYSGAPPPLIYAILTGRPDFVEKMIANGVDINFTLSRPGKVSDGMSPAEYANFLMNQEGFSIDREEYQRIVNLLVCTTH
jgi:hypothetical protein